MWRKTIGDDISSSTALSVESRGRHNNKQNNGGRSPTRGRSRSRGKSKFKGKTIVYWNCNKEGHKKNDCTEPKKKKGAGEDKVMMKGQRCGLAREGCVYGKQKQVSFWRDGKKKKIERLKLVHTDVCGPTTVKSLGAFVENETGNKIKCLKSDNEGEYRDGGFQEYCSNNGIRLIRTVKRTPQENSLAERMNRTIMEQARLQEHGIEKDNKEYMELDEPEDGQVPRTKNPEVLDETTDIEIGADDQQQVPETLNLRRSSRLT
ncbi:hypothetical protein RJ639_015082 [Escallonia herrerae]|uniref:Integrase catalytic domain-containing protein n=1 Tax=Escallonia herrerae TaxID=1293975 RepID=A0AA88VGP8_9ASTE|nr:hypothetical protein RJ639_015082 [Escallonia herrerae]